MKRVLVTAQTSKLLSLVFVPSSWIYNQKVIVFTYEESNKFAVLQSNFHNSWAWKYTSTLGKGISYAPTDCFYNFPFPRENINELDNVGEAYHEHRQQKMIEHKEGLTKTYNRFHDPEETSEDIARMRELHIQMDNAVAAAYGWADLDLGHGFHETLQGLRYTISEPARSEVLMRLLQLNHQRYEEEVAQGLHDKTKSKKKPPKESKPEKLRANGQLGLGLIEDPAQQPEMALELAPRPQNALSASEMERWERYKCAACGKIVPGFDAENHIREVHNGVDVGFVKVGG